MFPLLDKSLEGLKPLLRLVALPVELALGTLAHRLSLFGLNEAKGRIKPGTLEIANNRSRRSAILARGIQELGDPGLSVFFSFRIRIALNQGGQSAQSIQITRAIGFLNLKPK